MRISIANKTAKIVRENFYSDGTSFALVKGRLIFVALENSTFYSRCIEEEAGEGKKIVEITCDHQGEYEAQLELATKTEQEYERKARSRIGINDYVSTI